MEKRPDLSDALAGQLRQLQRNGMIEQSQNKYAVTPEGMTEKAHSSYPQVMGNVPDREMNIASDHVHEDAEAIEHIITPELEERLAALLDYPEKDPHNKEIPW